MTQPSRRIGGPLLQVLLLLLWCCASSAGAQEGVATGALHPCRVSGFTHEVQCGSVRRPLQPMQEQGVTIDVHFVVVAALARRKLPDPVFFLAGGPGQSAIQVAPAVMARLRRLNYRRDLVFVDLRGTGRSAPLECANDSQATLAQSLDLARQDTLLAQCLKQLQALPYGDLRFFATHLAVQDVDAVRSMLGARQINLMGASYGTRVVLEYQRQFAEHVRRAVIDGVAPPDMSLPQSAAIDNSAALRSLLLACQKEASCQARFAHLESDLNTLLQSLPRNVTVAHPLSGQPQQVRVERETVMAALRGPLYVPAMAAGLPLAITQAAQGRFEGLLALGRQLTPRGPQRLALGLHLSVICSEDALGTPVPREVGAMDLGSELGQFYRRACEHWPRAAVPSAFYRIGVSAAPVLLLSGGLDPVTPPRHAERVAQALGSKARHVVVPNAGHGVLSLGCMGDVLFRFFDAVQDSEALATDTSCAAALVRPTTFLPLVPGASP